MIVLCLRGLLGLEDGDFLETPEEDSVDSSKMSEVEGQRMRRTSGVVDPNVALGLVRLNPDLGLTGLDLERSFSTRLSGSEDDSGFVCFPGESVDCDEECNEPVRFLGSC